MKRWFKIDFNDVFFNGLTTNQIGILIKYRCYCQQFDVDELSVEQFKSNFEWKERQFLVQFLTQKGQLSDNIKTTLEQKKSKSGQNQDNFGANEDKIGIFLSSKNNDLAIYNIYNKDNNIKEKKEKREERENSADAPKKSGYAFEGKIIKLNHTDYEKWRQAFPDLNLNAELMQRDIWLSNEPPDVQKKWFMSTPAFFIKQNERRKIQHNELISNDNAREEFYL